MLTQKPPDGFEIHHRFPVMGTIAEVMPWLESKEKIRTESINDYAWSKAHPDFGNSKNQANTYWKHQRAYSNSRKIRHPSRAFI